MRTIAVLLLGASMAGAAVLQVGPINLTGTGTYFDPDWNPNVGEGLPGSLGIGVNATGTNGFDTVSISVRDVSVLFGGTLTVPDHPVFRPFGCYYSAGASTYPNCQVDINGISGFGTFSNIGGGAGLAQVYEYIWDPVRNISQPGQLLAEAQIVSYVNITSVKFNYPPPQDNVLSRFTATFDVVPVAHLPEPSGIYLIFTGMAFIGAKLSLRRK